MHFKSEQIKFVEMDDSLDMQARTFESGMNNEFDNSPF